MSTTGAAEALLGLELTALSGGEAVGEIGIGDMYFRYRYLVLFIKRSIVVLRKITID